MARIRSIKPEFATSDAIAALSIPARLHFALLWTYSDDSGRGVDNPRLIKAACWPLDDDMTPKKVEALQDELAAKGRIVRYEVAGKRYYEVANWSEHQKPQHPKPSVLPPAPERSHEGLMNAHEASPETAPVVVVGEVEVVGVGEVEVAAPPDPFETDFWPAYPRKVSKTKSATAWSAALKTATADEILDGLAAWLPYWEAKGEPEFIPHPTTWLNQQRWQDLPPPSPKPKLTRRGGFGEGLSAVAGQFLGNRADQLELASGQS